MRKTTGFTILEMLIVLAIMTIITAASIPSFAKFTKTARLRASARDICTALRSARRLAITTRISRAVKIYLYDYSTVPSLQNTLTFYETADSVETRRAAANIYFNDDTIAEYLTFTFSARGTTSGDTITVVDPNDRYIDITIEGVTGRVRIGDIEE